MNSKAVLTASVALTLLLAGCAAKKKLSATEYFGQARSEFKDGAYQLAIQDYREMLDQYPFSEQAEDAELGIAHAHFMAGNYAEAVAAFTDFQRRHPTSSHLAFVGYALGMCYARQMNTVDRDQSASTNANNYFATVAQQYPSSPFAELAREQLAVCRSTLAGHELYIADFYATRNNSKAAEMRLLNLLGRYDDTDTAADALHQLAVLYRKQNNSERAALADAAIAQRFPRSKYASVARRSLESSGNDGLLAQGDPMPQLLAGIPRPVDTTFAPPIQVPGLDREKRPSYSGSGIPALASPNPFGRGAGSYGPGYGPGY
ncbi:MAG TPA: outer membrane protein assembly factor BamD [Candidatus Kryptonia bacterium]|nr:outer membrane protein assembly factor BamD [Candidatus Kryptonia bacterium]